MNTLKTGIFFHDLQVSCFSLAVLLPEVIIFSFIAGFHPFTALTTTVILSVTTALFGSRPAMITGAAAAMAFLFADINQAYGLSYVLATTILAAGLQLLFAMLKVHMIVHFIPKAVISGFLNALAFFMISSQLPFLFTSPLTLFLFVLSVLGYFLFRHNFVRLPLAFVLISGSVLLNTVATLELPTLAQTFQAPIGNWQTLLQFPFTLEAFTAIFPYALTIALVGICESLLTAKVANKSLHSTCNKQQETFVLGVGNFITGLCGGFAGCGMIGTTITHLHHGGATRLSTVLPSLLALTLFIGFPQLFANIPLVAFAILAVFLGFSLIDWSGLKRLHRTPPFESLVMVMTMIIIVTTHNLAAGIIIGIIVSALGFVYRAAKIEITSTTQENQTIFFVHGALFSASSNYLLKQFEVTSLPNHILLDFSQARIFDESAILAIDTLIARLERQGTTILIQGESQSCHEMLNRLAYHRHPNGLKSMPLH